MPRFTSRAPTETTGIMYCSCGPGEEGERRRRSIQFSTSSTQQRWGSHRDSDVKCVRVSLQRLQRSLGIRHGRHCVAKPQRLPQMSWWGSLSLLRVTVSICGRLLRRRRRHVRSGVNERVTRPLRGRHHRVKAYLAPVVPGGPARTSRCLPGCSCRPSVPDSREKRARHYAEGQRRDRGGSGQQSMGMGRAVYHDSRSPAASARWTCEG